MGSPGSCVLVHWIGPIGDGSQSFVIRWSFGGKGIVTWTDRDVVPADGLTRVFTQKQWEALWPPRLDSDV